MVEEQKKNRGERKRGSSSQVLSSSEICVGKKKLIQVLITSQAFLEKYYLYLLEKFSRVSGGV